MQFRPMQFSGQQSFPTYQFRWEKFKKMDEEITDKITAENRAVDFARRLSGRHNGPIQVVKSRIKDRHQSDRVEWTFDVRWNDAQQGGSDDYKVIPKAGETVIWDYTWGDTPSGSYRTGDGSYEDEQAKFAARMTRNRRLLRLGIIRLSKPCIPEPLMEAFRTALATWPEIGPAIAAITKTTKPNLLEK